MKKGLIFCVVLTVLNIILFSMVISTIEENEITLVSIDPSNKELEFKGLRPRLTIDEVNQISKSINADLFLLKKMKGILIITSICLTILLLLIIKKSSWNTTRFDGLTLLFITILLFSLHWLLILFNNKFENGYNATINIRIVTEATLLIIQPILFFMAYKLNNMEISKKLHQYKWISFLSLILCIACTVITLIIGIGLLAAPDLGGNWG